MLTLDYANCLSDRVASHGLDPDRLALGGPLADAATRLTAQLEETRGTGWERWRLLCENPMRGEHVGEIKKLVSERANKFENLVVLGIGGSALGNIALQAALRPATHNLLPAGERNGPRVFVVDNVDPMYLGDVINACKANGGIEKTCFNVVSKSGETAETAAQFMIVRKMLTDALGASGLSSNVVAVTDPDKGTMRTICDGAGIPTLPVPEGVGGRFSVLSPVGLFSAAMVGIDIDALLDGAAAMEARCRRPELAKNPAAMLATLLVELGSNKGKVNHVLMPYSNRLYLLADWFRQLWAESLGKEKDLAGERVFAGYTPIKALGTTDQHSQVQLYREGPNDKVIGLLEVGSFDAAGASDVQIPGGMGVEAIQYLEEQSLAHLLNAEKRATEYALVESNRPNFTLKFPKLDEHHVGEFIMLWEVVTAYAGLLLNIDAYDQPAVELGKKATFGLMGRDGYGDFKTKVDGVLEPTKHVITE
ncbi:MAG: glucose-6-phosphate isomerase [Planctomycetota bacterium]